MTDSWTIRVLELQAFKEANGHTNVPKDFQLNQALGHWVRDQRQAKAEGTLNEEQIKALEHLGFDFQSLKPKPVPQAKPTTQLKVWEKHFEELAEYKKENGNFQGIVSNKPVIGDWLRRQKRYYRDNTLKQDRINRLKELGVTFKEPQLRSSSDTRKSLPWETQYQALVGKCIFKELLNVEDDVHAHYLLLSKSIKMKMATPMCQQIIPPIKACTNGPPDSVTTSKTTGFLSSASSF